jgi:Uncharacterized protein conserved in bacteria (DUF2255)
VRQKAGRIIAAGMTKEVAFEPVDGPINDRIDDAYRTKCHSSAYLSAMTSARARSATVKVMPRETSMYQNKVKLTYRGLSGNALSLPVHQARSPCRLAHQCGLRTQPEICGQFIRRVLGEMLSDAWSLQTNG